MNGKRNLSEESIEKFIIGLDLNKQESDFFRNLVHFNQFKNSDEKNKAYQKLIGSQKYRKLKPLEKVKYDYYSKWYHPAIRELIAAKDYDGTSQWLSNKLFPEVSVDEVERSIHLLSELGFIVKNNKGQWEQAETILSTGQEVTSTMVNNYHKTILDLAKFMHDKLPAKERDVSTMTLGVHKDQAPKLKQMIYEFRQQVLSMVSCVDNPEDVLQLNIQLFPLTKRTL